MISRFGFATIALVCCAAGPLRSQESGAFLVRLGNDTVAVESYIRTASRLSVDQVNRAPRTTLRHFVVELGADGAATRAEAAVFRPGAPDRPFLVQTVTFHGDSATLEIRRGDSVTTRTFAAPSGTVPLMVPPYAFLSLLTEKVRRAGRDSVSVMAYQPGAPQARAVPVRLLGTDSMIVQLSSGPIRARVDRAGRFLGSEAPEATAHHLVSPVAGVDLPALAAAFAARDSAGQGMGVLSPRDTVRAAVAGANLMVDYGRPMKRGRAIFGGIVPWGRVWRTGANAATQLRTDHDLVIGGVTVPAGTYTLWTIPDPAGWKLVVNRQTGQWGTEYHPEQDLARFDMQAAEALSAVEQFTISIAPAETGGVLLLAWDRTTASVRFSVR